MERYLAREVLPLYANTHTSTSATGLQTTCFRHEARQIVAQAVNANSSKDVVLFCGRGVTGCVNTLVRVLGLHVPLPGMGETRPVVFVGPHEHHSNLLPWRESCAEVVVIRERQAGAHAQPIVFQPPYGWEAYVAGLDVSRLGEEGYVLVRRFLLRVHELRPSARAGLADELAAWVGDRTGVELPTQQPSETFLVAVAAAYQRRYAPPASQPDVWQNTFLPPGAIPPPVWHDEQPSSTWGAPPDPS